MADKTQQVNICDGSPHQRYKIAQQLSQALANISNGAPFVMEKLQLSDHILGNLNKGQQDIQTLIKDLQEINRLIKAKSNNKKVENGYEVSKKIASVDFESGQDVLFEHFQLLDNNSKGDLVSMILKQKQKDLPEKSIVYLLNAVLNEFNTLNFSSTEKSVNVEFVSSLISKEEIKASFALITAFLTTSITKSNLIKELRKNPIKQMVRLLEVIFILLQHISLVPLNEDKYIPSFEQICEWVEALLDAYYLNFCLKEDWKNIIEKIDAEIEQRNELYEQSKAFNESINTYQKCYDNIQKSINKTESQFYVKSIYL